MVSARLNVPTVASAVFIYRGPFGLLLFRRPRRQWRRLGRQSCSTQAVLVFLAGITPFSLQGWLWRGVVEPVDVRLSLTLGVLLCQVVTGAVMAVVDLAAVGIVIA